MRRMRGWPAIGRAGLAQSSVNGRSRVPSPAASTSACMLLVVEEHVGDRQTALVAVTDEQPPVGVEHVIGWPPAEGRGCRRDAAFAPFDFHVGADRCLVDGDQHVVKRELLTVLLIA